MKRRVKSLVRKTRSKLRKAVPSKRPKTSARAIDVSPITATMLNRPDIENINKAFSRKEKAKRTATRVKKVRETRGKARKALARFIDKTGKYVNKHKKAIGIASGIGLVGAGLALPIMAGMSALAAVPGFIASESAAAGTLIASTEAAAAEAEIVFTATAAEGAAATKAATDVVAVTGGEMTGLGELLGPDVWGAEGLWTAEGVTTRAAAKKAAQSAAPIASRTRSALGL